MSLLLSVFYTVTCLVLGPAQGQSPSDNDVQLVNGPDQLSGIVEVYRSGVWGRVCPTGWNAASAGVVCKQLGFDEAVSFHTNGERLLVNWEVSPTFTVASLSCLGSENSLSECTVVTTAPSCPAGDAAGVVCRKYSEGDIRLAGGSAISGRVEIYVGGAWYPACSDVELNEQTQELLCLQLGRRNSFLLPHTPLQQSTSLTIVGNITCSSSHMSLRDCLDGRVTIGPTSQCSSGQVINIRCSQNEGNVRLVGGPLPNSGQIEMFHGGVWNSVCMTAWRDETSTVACRQMGFTGFSSWFSSSELSVVSSTSTEGRYAGIVCDGTEESIFGCAFNFSTTTPCGAGGRTILVCQGTNVVPTVTSLTATPESVLVTLTLSAAETNWVALLLDHPSTYTLTYATQSTSAPVVAVTSQGIVRNGTSITASFAAPGEGILPFVLYRGSFALAVQGARGTEASEIFYADISDRVSITVTPTSATIQWPLFSSSSASLSSYSYSYTSSAPLGLDDSGVSSIPSSASTLNLPGLQEGATYTFVLIPSGISLAALPSTRLLIEFSTTFTTASAAPTGEPLNFVVDNSSIASSSAQISWELPSVAERNGDITHFVVGFNTSSAAQTTAVVMASTFTTYTYLLQGLRANTVYLVTVAAATVNGTGPSAVAQLMTAQATNEPQNDPTFATVPVIVAGVVILVALIAIVVVLIVAAVCIWHKKFRGSYEPKANYWIQSHRSMLGMDPSNDITETSQTQTKSSERARIEPVQEEEVQASSSPVVEAAPKMREGSYDSLSPKEISAIISETNGNNNSSESLVADKDWNPYARPLIHNREEEEEEENHYEEEENHYEGVVIPPHTYEDPQSVQYQKSQTLPAKSAISSGYSLPYAPQYNNIPGTNIVDATHVKPHYANTLDSAKMQKLQSQGLNHAQSAPFGSTFLTDESNGYATPRKFPIYDSIEGNSSVRYDVMSPEQSDGANGTLTSSTPIPPSGLF